MALATLPRGKFRTPKLLTGDAAGFQVDRQAGVIRGANLMQIGDLNDSGEGGRPWHVDDETLAQVHTFLAARGAKGLKARFTHPDMSSDGLGSYLGRWRNGRRDGDKYRADLHFSRTAYDTPKGDLANYVMDLAEEELDAIRGGDSGVGAGIFGVSLATSLDEEAMFGADGEMADGAPLRFADLRAGDVVDEPAATRGGLFSLDLGQSSSDIPYAVEWLLNTHFSKAEPEELLERFRGFLCRHFKTELPIMTTATEPKTPPSAATLDDFRQAAREYVDLFGEQGASWFAEGKTLQECFALRLQQVEDERTKDREGFDAKLAEETKAREELQAKFDKLSEGAGETDPFDASPNKKKVGGFIRIAGKDYSKQEGADDAA